MHLLKCHDIGNNVA
jgi:hypothetical protein